MNPLPKPRWRVALTSVVLLFLHQEALALVPAKAVTQYHQDVWTERDGLPQGTVQAIAQTRDGYLWVGTRDGLARFDGATFTVLDRTNIPGLAAITDYIQCLAADKVG